VYGERMRVVATRSPAGDLVVIATNFPVWETLALYRPRWSIECTFGSLNTRVSIWNALASRRLPGWNGYSGW